MLTRVLPVAARRRPAAPERAGAFDAALTLLAANKGPPAGQGVGKVVG